MYRVTLRLSAVLLAGSLLSTPAQAIEVYFFKGAGDFSAVNKNMHFSRGLNDMADVLAREGIHAEVRRFSAIEDALATIRKRNPSSVAFIGHSMGALASMAAARNLKGGNVRIAYMGLIDIPGPVGVAGDNVEWVENYYSINPVYGVLTNTASHPNARNIHIPGTIHTQMDDAPHLQKSMLDAIRKIHAEEQQQIAPQRGSDLLLSRAPAAPQYTGTRAVEPQPEVVTYAQPLALPSVSQTTVAAQPIQEAVVQPQSVSTAPKKPAKVARPVPSQRVDRISTGSVARPSALQTGKKVVRAGRKLLKRTGNYLRGLKVGSGRAPKRQTYER